jgi:hypothetical protein
MQNFYITESKRVGGDLNVKCTLSSGSVLDLKRVEWQRFFPKIPDIEIFSDASMSGWGAVCDGVVIRGPWTTAQTSLHINQLELTGALYALQSFAGEAQGLSIRIYLDNSTAVCYINRGGETRSSELTTTAKKLTEFCEMRNILIEAVISRSKECGNR